MEQLVCPLTALAILLVLPLVWLVANYNRMARVRQHIRESWADIDVELKRRYDLIPNLVATVKGYAAHEQDVLQRLMELRSRAMDNHGPAASQAAEESALLLGLKQLFVRVEAYPDLRADSHFLALQQELANTEDRIAAARRFFNANVREMNQLCQSFPTNLVARWFGFHTEDYFELSDEAERVVPRVASSGFQQSG